MAQQVMNALWPVLLLLLGFGSNVESVRLGYFAPYKLSHLRKPSFLNTAGGAYIAMNTINANNSIMPGEVLEVEWFDDKSQEVEPMNQLITAQSRNETSPETERLDGIIGPAADGGCESTGLLASIERYNLPVIGYSCMGTGYRNEDKISLQSNPNDKGRQMPTFVRTNVAFEEIGGAVIDFVRLQGWTNVGMVTNKQHRIAMTGSLAKGPGSKITLGVQERAMGYTIDEAGDRSTYRNCKFGSLGADGKPNCEDAVKVNGPDSGGVFNMGPERIPFPCSMDWTDDDDFAQLINAMKHLKQKARVIILNINEGPSKMYGISMALEENNMLNGEYFFIIPITYGDWNVEWAREGWTGMLKAGSERNITNRYLPNAIKRQYKMKPRNLYEKLMKHTIVIQQSAFPEPAYMELKTEAVSLMGNLTWEASKVGPAPECGEVKDEGSVECGSRSARPCRSSGGGGPGGGGGGPGGGGGGPPGGGGGPPGGGGGGPPGGGGGGPPGGGGPGGPGGPGGAALTVESLSADFTGYLHDAVMLYAHTRTYMLANGQDPRDGRDFYWAAQNVSFLGVSGPVKLNVLGDRYGSYEAWQLVDFTAKADGLSFKTPGTVIKRMEFMASGGEPVWTPIEPPNKIVWNTLNTEKPTDIPYKNCVNVKNTFKPVCKCLRNMDITDETERINYVVTNCIECLMQPCPPDWQVNAPYWAPPTLIALIALIALAVVKYRAHTEYERSLMEAAWKMPYTDDFDKDWGMGVQSTGLSIKSYGTQASQTFHLMMNRAACRYKGDYVYVKHLKNKDISWRQRRILVELKTRRDLQHDNITPFVGACVDPPDICLTYPWMQKGCLDDVLQNTEIQLDYMFKTSIGLDICAGLKYLKKSGIGHHGNLKSINCLVDDRWNVKLSNFGLRDFMKEHYALAEKEEQDYPFFMRKLWTAPELLGTNNPQSAAGDKADIYSLGIILHEVMFRLGAYGKEMEQGLEPKDIIEKVKMRNGFRPSTVDCPEKAGNIELIQMCWGDAPNERAHVEEIRRELITLSGGKQINIMDNMVKMLEKYATNLEGIVAERTSQLAQEKKKVELLLYQMLPKAVADQLKEGKTMDPEAFDCVTIFFSDIVGFTSLSAASTPFQVVNLLNDLYTEFDTVIDMFDVYKVETIGDAYMVVSGLPIRNGDLHAGEIAGMSLELLSCILSFKIRHIPGRRLLLRAGIHSGSVVAGVVGLKMPRYCLFGDTVNTASRMESNGLALKVHVSPECTDILKKLGGFHLPERGLVEMKGKGKISTFWLTGREGYAKPLPTEEDLKNAHS